MLSDAMALKLVRVPSARINGVACFRPASKDDDGAVEELAIALWTAMTNEEDRPAAFNQHGQLPMARLYIDGTWCLNKYLGTQELCGQEVRLNVAFDRRERGFITALDTDDDVSFLVEQLNAHAVLRDRKQSLSVE